MRMLLFTALMLGMLGCSGDSLSGVQPDEHSDRVDAVMASKYGRTNGAVIVPFKSHFVTESQPVPPGFRESCGDRPFPPFDQVIQAGYGEGTHLGSMSFTAQFCVDITDFLDDGMLTEGESVPYDNGRFVITAANGDELWGEISGEVLPSDDPDIREEFFDPFDFVGGTGRFEGATGSGMTSSFVDLSGVAHHNFSGKLFLPRGR